MLDYAGHADAIIVPLLDWARRQQPELFDNPELRQRGIRFSVEYLTTDTVDLAIELDLTERVLVRPRANAPEGALDAIHVPEPPPAGAVLQAERWRLYLRDQQLAEWHIEPR